MRISRTLNPIRTTAMIAALCAGAPIPATAASAQPELLKLDGDLAVHDPAIMKEGNTYYVFATGRAPGGVGIIPIRCSTDMRHWALCGSVFQKLPDWVAKEVPKARDAWAPDISFFNGKYHLYYALSSFGVNDSAIGLATNETLDPKSPKYQWADEGMVVRSRAGEDDFNAIDPNLAIESKDKLWLNWGSFWGGIKMKRIDPQTGKLSSKDTTLYSLASRPRGKPHQTPPVEGAIEAPFITRHGDYWYLFASFDFCCRGVRSDYNVVAGRSKKITGPYLDKSGEPMTEGGGTPVVAAVTPMWHGAGHEAVFRDGKTDYLLFHAYDPATGRPQLQISTMAWDDGWPRVAGSPPAGKLAPRPLYRDPPFDAPTDPVLCFNAEQKKWFMYYTARRATAVDAPGVTWIHGSNIGMAESSDGGATWTYRGIADIRYGKDTHPNDYTYWAPEVIWHNGTYHMFLSFVPGIFNDWNHPREIVHLTSKGGVKWETAGPVDLKSDRVIDACVIQLPDGAWRMWYKDERKPKSLSYADSPDLFHWEAKGNAVTDRNGEGPKVIHWKGKYWLIADTWATGMRVWSSDDCLHWTPQDETLIGSHGDVVISGDRAWWFYFGGPQPLGPSNAGAAPQSAAPSGAPRPVPRRSTAINVMELSVVGGKLTAGDPDQPTFIDLKPVREAEN